MDQLTRSLQVLKEAERNLELAVAAERAMGRSWANIGARLGVTRQAAFKRFGRVPDARTGEMMTARSTDHLKDLTETFFSHVSQGDEALTMGMMHPSVRKELPWDTIADTWKRCLAEYGSWENAADTYVTHPGGTTEVGDLTSTGDPKILGIAVGVTRLNHEAGEIMGRVAFDQDDAVVGVLLLPTGTPAETLPF